jgi:hypothetical protein
MPTWYQLSCWDLAGVMGLKFLLFYGKKVPKIKVEGSVSFLDGVKNCTDSVHKFSRAFLLCYEFVQFLTPSKNLTDPSTFSLYSFCHKILK